MSMEQLARRSQATFETFVGMIYFVPEGPARYAPLGLDKRQYYFCSRASAMGAVSGAVVAATFYNFNPQVVIPLVDNGWRITTPTAVGHERTLAVGEALQRLLAPAEGEADVRKNIEPALALVKRATANLLPDGRNLFAAYNAQEWPTEPTTALWWGLNLLREFRGDGHLAALLVENVGGLESLLLQAAYKPLLPLGLLIKSRAWEPAAVEAAQARLAERDVLKDGALTTAGQELRERIEQLTDQMDTAPFQNLGEADTQKLLDLVQPLTHTITAHGGIPGRPAPAKS